MNKLQDNKNITVSDDLSEEQQILKNAEFIIKQINNKSVHKFNHVFFLVLLPFFIVTLLALIFSTIFAIITSKTNTIIDGVYIQGIPVSGLTIDESKTKISEELSNNLSKEIHLTRGDYAITLLPSQLNMYFDIDSAVDNAYSFGRSSNIFKNNYDILQALNTNINITASLSCDTNTLNNIINEININLPDCVIQPSYYIDNNNLVISSGKDGVIVDTDTLIHDILLLLSNNSDEITIDLPVLDKSCELIDIDSIYSEVYKTPVDASYQTDPYIIHPSSTGLDFDISIEEAKNLLLTPQEEYSIPLKTLYPNVNNNQLGLEAFPDLLSEFSTSFRSSNSNRSTNIILSAEKINGTVLLPGETFSYNTVVGRRTKEAGYKPAPAYLNGEVVQEYGGGICQVSSTLYNAVLYANLEVDERSNHAFKPSYVLPGLDATVSWGGPDFKFTNNREYPIKIICDTSGKIVHVYIYGLKTENDYTVKLDAHVVSRNETHTRTATYKILYDKDGNFISKDYLYSDTYKN